MGSFKEVQEILPLCLEDEIIDDEEFILLYEAYMPQNPSFPHSSYGKFSIVNKDPAECKADFRVEKGDIPILVEGLRVPPIFKCNNGTMNNLRWNSRFMRTPSKICIFLPLFGHDSDIWPISVRTEHHQQ